MIENFGQNIARLRKEKSMSQEELAEKLGVTKQTISNIERGARYPTFEALGKLADIFEAGPMDLFGTLKEIAVYDTNATLDRIDEYDSKIRSLMQIQKFFDNNSFSKIVSLENSIRYIEEKLDPIVNMIPILDEDGLPVNFEHYERSSITRLWNLAKTLENIEEHLYHFENEDFSDIDALENRINELYSKMEELKKKEQVNS